MALFRTGLYVKNHSVEKVQVAKTPIASFNGNVTGLYIPELIAYITAKQSGSGTPSPDNIRPIIGVSECNVVRCGKNLWSNEKAVADSNTSIVYIEDGVLNFKSGPNPLKYYLKCNSQVVLSCKLKSTVNTNVGFRAYYSDGTNTQILSVTLTANVEQSVTTIATTSGKELAYISSMYTDNRPVMMWDAQLELGSTATDYEAYTGNTYTIQLGDTCYGGSLDVTTGVLTIMWLKISGKVVQIIPANYNNITYGRIPKPNDSIDKSHATTNIMDSMYKVDNATSNWDDSSKIGKIFGGADYQNYWIGFAKDTTLEEMQTESENSELVYGLATPVTVQLSPTQIEQLLGVNNVFADCGDVEVKFYNVVR